MHNLDVLQLCYVKTWEFLSIGPQIDQTGCGKHGISCLTLNLMCLHLGTTRVPTSVCAGLMAVKSCSETPRRMTARRRLQQQLARASIAVLNAYSPASPSIDAPRCDVTSSTHFRVGCETFSLPPPHHKIAHWYTRFSGPFVELVKVSTLYSMVRYLAVTSSRG